MKLLNFGEFCNESNSSPNIFNDNLLLEANLGPKIDNDIKFAIIMATHDISNSMANKNRAKYITTPEVLRDSLMSIKNQKYTNWKLYLTADKYGDDTEILKIIKEIIPRVYMNGRKNLIQRSLNNLIDNSIKYAENINFHLSKKDSSIIITIDDDGVGIPKEELENVFKPFYKVDKSRGDSKSSVGLGLSIASDIIKSHGGNILLEQSPLIVSFGFNSIVWVNSISLSHE